MAYAKFGLTWEDWFWTTKQVMAIRHRTEESSAKQEQENGGRGDAFSLVIPGLTDDFAKSFPAVLAALEKRLAEITWKYCNLADVAFYSEKLNQSTSTDSEKKEYLTALFNMMLFECITACGKGVFTSDSHDYLLLSNIRAAQRPYDFNRYPIGKCGSDTTWAESDVALRIHLTGMEQGDAELSFSTITGGIQAKRRKLVGDTATAPLISASIGTQRELPMNTLHIVPKTSTDQASWSWKEYSLAAAGLVGCAAVFYFYKTGKPPVEVAKESVSELLLRHGGSY